MEYKRALTCESNLLFWGLDVAYFREKKEIIFMILLVLWRWWRSRNTGRDSNEQNYTIAGTKYQEGLHKQIKAATKLARLWSN